MDHWKLIFKTGELLLTSFLLLLLLVALSPVLPLKNIPGAFIVLSGSMEPNIKSGSLVITKPVDPRSLKIGDIIAFSSPSNPRDTILHRINSIKSTNSLRFSTKGDNNNTPDRWDVTDVGVKGLYQFSLPYFGNIFDFIRRPLGFVLIICLPALLFVVSELFKIKKIIDNGINHRFRRKHKLISKKTIVILFFFTQFSLIFNAKNIYALYTSMVLISDLSFSIGEFIPPESSISLDDNFTRNIHNFDIASVAVDNISVSNIKLYYSFNYGPWQLFPEIIFGNNGTFHFNSPSGDGLYSFESLATDMSGNVEVKEFYYFNQLIVDTLPPTTNLNNRSLSGHIYNGQNYLTNGDFENGISAWHINSSTVEPIVNNTDTNNSNALRLGSDTGTINNVDSLSQMVSLPASTSSTLNFSYRFLSHDIAEYDHFKVDILDISGQNVIENILNIGNISSDLDYDSGWQSLSRDLTHLSGLTIKLNFSLTDTGSGDLNNSWVFLDNLRISTLNTRVGESSFVNFYATDLGSGIIDSTPDSAINTGENNLTFNSVDLSGNTESSHFQSVVVLSTVLLNKINKNKIEIFNNSLSDTVDLINYSYTIDTASPISIGGTILPQHSFDIILSDPLPESCQVTLFNNNNVVDSTNIVNLGPATWQRIYDGLGPWSKYNAPPSFNLEPRLSVSKITLTVSGLASTLADMTYTIDYSDNSGAQQIYGQILPNTIDVNGNTSRDFYLGTCSSGGTCSPAIGIGDSFTVTFSTLPSQTFIF